MSKACARLSSTHGPAMSASGSALPNRALPTVTTELGCAMKSLSADHDGRRANGSTVSSSGLFDRGERRRSQKRTFDVGDDLSVLLAVGAGLDPGRVGEELVPQALALGERFPG